MVSDAGVELSAEQMVRELCPNVTVWELSRKIRTNKAIADFLRALFKLPQHPKVVSTNSVKISSADGPSGAQALVDTYRSEGYQFIAYGSPIAGEQDLDEIDTQGCPAASEVIGQEFDKVVMVVGARFSAGDGSLYQQLLFQGLTRARNNIALVILNNPELLAELLTLLVPAHTA